MQLDRVQRFIRDLIIEEPSKWNIFIYTLTTTITCLGLALCRLLLAARQDKESQGPWTLGVLGTTGAWDK